MNISLCRKEKENRSNLLGKMPKSNRIFLRVESIKIEMEMQSKINIYKYI